MRLQKRTVVPPRDRSLPVSAAVRAQEIIYLSGTVAEDDSGEIAAKSDVAAQTRHVIDRLQSVLSEAGSSLAQAVAVTVYLRNATDFQAMNDAYRTFWSRDPPTRTTIIADPLRPDAVVEMSVVAVPAGADRVALHPDGWMRSPNPYSYAIATADTLFLSGLVARNGRDNSVVPGDVSLQTRVIMDNAGELLNAAGMTHANVVSARVFLPDLSAFEQMNAVYRSYFPVSPPARATVAARLAGSQHHVEITMIASSAKRRAFEDSRAANPNLSPAIEAGGRVYLSGMLGTLSDGALDAGTQTREVLAKARRSLEASGCTPADVVDAIVYLTDPVHEPAIDDAYRAFFGESFPARTTVHAGLVPTRGVVEIMMTAARS